MKMETNTSSFCSTFHFSQISSMNKKMAIGLLVVGIAAAFAASAVAETTPVPVVYLKLNGNFKNSGSGGCAYDGTLEQGSANLVHAYVADRKGNANSAVILTPTTAGTANGTGNDLAISYKLTNSGTIDFWYKTASTKYRSQELYNNSAGPEAWEMWIYESNTLACHTGVAGGNTIQTSATFDADTWYNIVFTWTRETSDPSKVDCVVYVNGKVVATATGASWIIDPGRTFYLGGNHNNTCAIGSFDDVVIYDTALTAAQVASVYANGVGVAELHKMTSQQAAIQADADVKKLKSTREEFVLYLN